MYGLDGVEFTGGKVCSISVMIQYVCHVGEMMVQI